jgi:hypothetical protein
MLAKVHELACHAQLVTLSILHRGAQHDVLIVITDQVLVLSLKHLRVVRILPVPAANSAWLLQLTRLSCLHLHGVGPDMPRMKPLDLRDLWNGDL